jgi:D-alanyl-D-alanine carboxypeptidase
MSRFETFLSAVIERATDEARLDGSGSVEAQHLLLAIADHDEPTTREVLASIGLDGAAIRAALDQELERSLAAAGVSVSTADIRELVRTRDGRPGIGTSFRLAMERGVAAVARRGDLRPAHLLLGIVAARVGTVPRALALAGIERSALLERIGQTVGATKGSGHGLP